MTSTETKEFAGRPINGEISRYSEGVKEQRPTEELVAALDALWAFDEVEAVKWRQCTPYFNDGDACTFGSYGISVKLKGIDEGGDYDDGFLDGDSSYPDGYWNTHSRWAGDSRYGGDDRLPIDPNDATWEPYGLSDDDKAKFNPPIELQRAVIALNSKIESGEHNVVLQEKFGDPAEVTATREGFSVESYDHD